MTKRILAMLLALCMLLALTACGGTTPASSAPADSTGASSAEPADAEVDKADAQPDETDEAPADTDEAPAESAVEPAEPEEVERSFEYPIEGDHEFTMVSVLRMNAAEALGDGNYTDTPPYEAIQEATGVSLDMQLLGESTYSEKMNLMMASGDLPDFFSQTAAKYDMDMISGIEDGILLDMADLLEENAPDYKALLDSDPVFASGVYNTDGSLTQFAGRAIARQSQGLLIRQDWLDDLGLEAPKNFDELTNVLEAFHNEKDASMALLVNFECDCGLAPFFNTSFMGFRSVGYQRVEPGSDELICSYASEGFISYLNYLHELFDKGIFTDDFMTTGKEYGNWESSYYGDKAGVWQDDCKYVDPAFRENAADPNWVAAPFALTDIDVHVSQPMVVAMAGKLFITQGCEEPEIAMQYVNYAYTPEGKNIAAYGKEGVSWEYDDDGEVQFTDIITNNPDGLSMDIALVYYTPAQWLPTDQQERYLELTLSPEAVDAYKLWTEAYGDDTMCLPTDCTLTSDEMMEYFTLASDVLTAVTEHAARVVIGEETEADYRALIDSLEASSLGQMDEIYEGAYARYLENN